MRLTMARGELEGIRAARSLGDWTDLPPTRTVEQAEPATSPTKSPALGKLIDEYLTEKRTRGDTAPKRLLDFNAALMLFRQWCGDDTPAASIDAAKIGQFRSLLAKLPSNHTKRFPDLTLEQIVEEAEKRGLPPRDASTVNQKYLALLEAFFEWAKRGALIGSNPAVGIRAEVSRSRVRRHKRRPFSLDHLKRIYSAPLYTGCASDARIYEPGDVLVNDHRRWIPLLSLFTGARLNELCQLRVRDVRTVDGVLCLDINDEDGKRLKTRASMRLVPLHPELLRLGFEDYVASLPKGSSLWPEMETGTTGYSSDAVSKWFIRFLDKTLGHADRKRAQLSHHSFRHTMKDRMREVGIDERIQDAFIGHETAHVSAAYGTGYRPRAILAEISKVHFEGLSLEHLYPPPISIAA